MAKRKIGEPNDPGPSGSDSNKMRFAVTAAMVGAFLWSYWPTLTHMVHEWIRLPDYSHGFLVVPVATFFLWSRRKDFPASELSFGIVGGGGLLLLAAALRYLAALYFLLPIDGWTIPIWIGGTVWLLYGWKCFRWSLPAIIFLWFMFPIPFSAERMFSVPLQAVATKLSTAALLMLGQPALSEGNTILLGDNTLFVEEACSGLRIFVGVVALAFAYVLFTRWDWWQKLLVMAAALPVAIIANMIRIVGTGLLYQYATSDAARHFSHDLSGILMVPLAASFFFLFVTYLNRLFPEIEEFRPHAS